MAIRSKDGRTWTEPTAEESFALLKEEFAKLTPEEQRLVLIAIKEQADPSVRAALGGQAPILDVLKDGEYIRPLVDIETFVRDPYYLGASSSALWPGLLEDVKEIFRGGYQEIIIGGGIGVGKTYVGSIIVCRVIYELSCLRDIHKTVGLAPGSDVSIVGISVNEALAQRVVFDNITTKVAQSPYFKDNFPFQETKKELRFPNNVLVCALSTTDTSALGRNVIAALMDEGNFYEDIQRGKASIRKYGDRDKARVLYDQMVRRMKSRFLKDGRMPGKMVIVSSKRTKDDFTAKRVAEAGHDPTVYVMDYRLWELVPERFGSERFHVLVGNEALPSRILRPEEVESVRKQIDEVGDESLVILEVPEEFRHDFETGLEDSIRDIGGVSTVSVSPFIQQRDKIENCIDSSRSHPFEVEEWDQGKPGSFIWERLCKNTHIRDGAEIFKAWQPLHYPGHARHIHIDFSLNTDYTGITCGCIAGSVQVERRNRDTGELYFESSPQIWIDFMLRIKPPSGGEIDFGQVRGLVYQLQSHGFHISLLTSDQAHSAANMQKFSQKGITVERVSVDRPIDAYDTLKTAIYERRVLMYRYEPVLDELRKLQKNHIKEKVDHQRAGRKDVADSLAGVVYTLSINAHHAPIAPIKGISQYADPEHEKDRKAVEDTEFFPPFLIG